jgi:hypothetical protein
MKAHILRFSITILLLMALYLPASNADGQEAESVQSQGTDRPLVIIKSYYLNQDTIRPNDSFSLYIFDQKRRRAGSP